jgi:N,N'-diacetyllegionaminate synthase
MKKKKKTFIIAEAGVNHNGSLEIAKRLIDAAKSTGADAIKFQTFKADRLVSKSAEKAVYQKMTSDKNESQYSMLKKLELTKSDHLSLIRYCHKKRMQFLSSAFDEKSADLLDNLGVKVFKIPSGEITNIPYLRHLGRKNKPLIISTGMATLGEVENAIETIYSTGNNNLTLLHCVSEYPAPYREINLNAMITLREAFKLPVGYSDHTSGIEISIAAVALGAVIIEKHFTLDKDMEGPDHRASLEPSEFHEMVKSIRNVDHSLGDGKKKPAPCEKINIPIVRKSLVSIKKIEKGEILSKNNIAVKRPGHGIQPEDLYKIIGRTVKVTIKPDQVITWDKLS